jgi:hypothetical protein
MTRPEETQMDIHKPKPVHSIKEFLNEIVVIIIGVLIALGLEQAVESWHQHLEVAEAREALRKESAENLGVYAFNLGNRTCTLGNIAVLRALIQSGDIQAVRAATAQENLLRAGLQQYGADTTVWDTINASSMLSHMDSEERLLFAKLYGFFTNEKIFRVSNYNKVVELTAKGRDFDGSSESSRDLLHDLALIDYFYRTRVADYPRLIKGVDKRLHIKPRAQKPDDPFLCRRLPPDGTLS